MIKCFKYSPDGLIFCGIAEDYDSFNFERSYANIGNWQCVINAYSEGAQWLLNADIISVGDGIAGLITSKTIVQNDICTISGVELKGIANKRIVYPPNGSAYLHYREAPEIIMANLLTTQITNSADERKIEGTVLRDDIISNKITYDGRFQNVADEIIALAEAYNIGWYADVQNGAIVWHIYHGKDRTAGQNTNSRYFIEGDGQLERVYHSANAALVAGQGEGTDRAIAYVNDDAANWNRTELYVDARDIADSTLLPQRGTEKLAEYGTDSTLTIEPHSEGYRSSYDLGDIGTYIPAQLDLRLTKCEEVYENGAFSLNFEYGYDAHTLSQRLNRMEKNNSSLFAKEVK